jgi:hypothetical protein
VLHVAGDTVFRKTVAPSTDYARYNTTFDSGRRAVAVGPIRRYLGDDHWQPIETRTVNGRAVIVFENGPGADGDARSVNASGRIAIDSRGVVHGFTYRERRRDGAGYERTVLTYELDPTIDVSVDPPGWLDDAKNATSATPPTTPTVSG